MVRLVVGTKGTGKTKKMIEMANHRAEESKGNIVFINKDHRLMYDLNHNIRVITMDDYEGITNSDEYIGFLYGIISSDHDIELIFIDSLLKHADINAEDVPRFLDRLRSLSEKYEKEFIVSISMEKGALEELELEHIEIL
jgi:hypothetical protein